MQFRIFVFDKSNTSFFPGDFPGGSVVKNPPANAGDVGWIPGLGKTPGGGYGNPLQYSCLGIPMGRGAWRATVHRVSMTEALSIFTFYISVFLEVLFSTKYLLPM